MRRDWGWFARRVIETGAWHAWTTGARAVRIHSRYNSAATEMTVPRNTAERMESQEHRVWRIVAHSPLDTLWRLHGSTVKEIAQRTWSSLTNDRIFGRAAEVGYYFLFSLFPTMFCAVAIFGLVVASAPRFYGHLLGYLALVIPHDALGMVLHIFDQTAAHASSRKITLSLLGAIWSASVGISSLQDILNDVYRIENTRSFLGARIKAIGLTFLVTAMITVSLASMLGSDFAANFVGRRVPNHELSFLAAIGIRVAGWTLATLLLILVFAVIYYWAPDWRKRRWRWITPGAAIGIGGWLIASIGLRVYLYFFNSYAVTYGSLGAVIILLTWFYITGLMLLVGAEINSEIEAAAVEKRLAEHRRKYWRPERAA